MAGRAATRTAAILTRSRIGARAATDGCGLGVVSYALRDAHNVLDALLGRRWAPISIVASAGVPSVRALGEGDGPLLDVEVGGS